MPRRVLGLDVGSQAVKAVELRQSLRAVEVGQLRVLPLDPPGPSLAQELREFVRAHELPTDHVVCSLPGDRISSRRLSFPFRDRRRIAQAVPFEVEGEVPFDLGDFFLDWEVVQSDRSHAEVLATLAPRSEVRLLLESLAEAGLSPRIVEAEGLVLANLAGVLELPGTRLLADIGHRKTTLCLLADGRPLAARTLPLAGEALTRALAKERGLSEGEAERLKLEVGLFADGTRSGGSEAHAVLDRLARELVRTLGALEPALAGRSVGEITLLGGTSRLHRLPEYLARRTGLPVALLPPPPEPWRSPLLSGGDPLLFGPALALALRATSLARTRMNFRQDEFARRLDLRQYGRDLRWTGALAGLVLALALVSMGAETWVLSRVAREVEGRSRGLYAEVFPGQPVPAGVLAALREAVRSSRGRADLLGVYAGNLSALDLLTELSARVPRDLPVIFEELHIDRQSVRVRGHTQSYENVDRLQRELAAFPAFTQIRVSEIQSDARRGGQTFNLTIGLGNPEGAS